MFQKKLPFLLTLTLFLLCAGIVSVNADKLITPQTLEVATSKPIQAVEQNPLKMSKLIIHDYFTAIQAKGNSEGAALERFSIGKVDVSNRDEILVEVTLKYVDYEAWPPVNYSIIKINDTYQVQKQICVYDGDPDSPTRGTVSVNKLYTINDGSISIRSND
jgi:hypothetical protein